MPTQKKDTSICKEPEEECSNNIMTEYLKITKEYVEKYGDNTILLLQVGAFFEVYGMRDNNGNIVGSKIEEFSQICQLNISDKKIFYDNKSLVMAGFRDYSLEKYLQKITDAGFTAVVFVQEKDGKKMKRVFHGVFSAGTYLSYETESTQQMTNNMMCIWIDTFKPIDRRVTVVKTRDTIIYGVSVINTYTGKSSIFEYQTPFFMNPTTFDELERCISVFSPSELIFMSPFEEKINTQILQFIGVKSRTIHLVNTGVSSKEKVTNCTKQVYIRHILSQVLGEDVQNICKEFQSNAMATQSFCYLLNFIQEHDKNLLKKISIPEFNNTSDRMVLANHTLKQLNIIDDDGKCNGQLSSVVTFLNKCCSSMGRRKFQSQLLNPVTNIEWLNTEYSMTENMLVNSKIEIEYLRKELYKMIDIEKVCRQIIVKKVYPSSMYK
jgi:DNA mismatch repair protein MutS